MHKCGKPHCGKFYHQHCVSQLPHAQIARDQEQEQGADDAEEEGVVKFKFTCPLHTCDLCGKGRESGSRSQLYPCWHCPRAYHANCIPPTSKYHEYLLLCPDHAHLELPHLPGWEDEEDRAAGGEQLLGGEAAAALAAGKVGGWVKRAGVGGRGMVGLEGESAAVRSPSAPNPPRNPCHTQPLNHPPGRGRVAGRRALRAAPAGQGAALPPPAQHLRRGQQQAAPLLPHPVRLSLARSLSLANLLATCPQTH